MPEDIETSLNWPDRGLRGVPDPSPDAEPPSIARAADAPVAPSAGGPGVGPGSTPLYDTELGEGISTIARSIDEFSSSTSELRSFLDGHTDASEQEAATKMSDALRGAELALIRLEQAAGTVSGKLESIAGVLGHQLAGLTTQLAFDRQELPDLDISLPSQTGFQGGLPGITPSGIAMDPSTGLPIYSGGTVTWPPLLPPRKKTIWTRLARPVVAIPLGLVLLACSLVWDLQGGETRDTHSEPHGRRAGRHQGLRLGQGDQRHVVSSRHIDRQHAAGHFAVQERPLLHRRHGHLVERSHLASQRGTRDLGGDVCGRLHDHADDAGEQRAPHRLEDLQVMDRLR